MSQTEKVKRLRFVTTVPPKSEVRLVNEDTEVSFVPMEAIGEDGEIQTDRTKPIGEVLNGYTYFAEGDVVLAKITPCFENGKGAIASHLVNRIGFGTTELHVLRAGRDLDSRFLFYVTKSHDFRKLGEAEMYGAGGQKRVPESFVRDFRAYVPCVGGQRAIADFLDFETTRIECLIQKKQTLARKLDDEKSELVSIYILGAHPECERKHSGSRWLGAIPAHWKTTRLKYATSLIVDCPHETPVYSPDGEFHVVRTADITRGTMDLRHAYRLSEDEYLHRVRRARVLPGDVVYGREGERWGFAASVPVGPYYVPGTADDPG